MKNLKIKIQVISSEGLVLKEKEIGKDMYWNVVGDNNEVCKFIIPIKARKKWWEFWKKNETETAINELMIKFKKDVNMSDGDYFLPVNLKSIDLRNCKRGDILISSQGAKLEYISPTPWKHYTYLDHVVRYIEDKDGKSMGDENYGTRTHDGFVFAMNRIPSTDHDIVEIIHAEDLKPTL